MKNVIKCLIFIGQEFTKPFNYILAVVVGLLINITTSGNPIQAITPYIVPVFVQAISKGFMRFKNRYMEKLLLLPKERDDPTFIMDNDGTIITSIGKTQKLFTENSIKNITEFLEISRESITNNTDRTYSRVTKKWYSSNVKFIENNYLVWLTDISQRIYLDLKLKRQSLFNNEILNSMDELTYSNDVFERMVANILSDDFRGIFLTQLDDNDQLTGYVYKRENGEIVKSDQLHIDKDSPVAITLSRKRNRIITDSISNYNNRDEFYKKNLFDNHVLEFLGEDVKNYINVHKGDISTIVFNKSSEITPYDQRVVESIVDSARIISSLLDLAHTNDVKFLEAMDGLCAAAEFSDEITGNHIYRVNVFSEMIAKEMKLDKKVVTWLGQVAAIHDIGKVAIPEIIKIDRVYTPEEREKMETHTIYGYKIIQKMLARSTKPDPRLELAKKIVLNHHQTWDGTGYPGLMDENTKIQTELSTEPGEHRHLRPLKGEEIPIEALIVSLADRYDALRSSRHYKEGFSHEKTVEILSKDDRTGKTGEDYFGPEIFKIFKKIHLKMDAVYNEMSK